MITGASEETRVMERILPGSGMVSRKYFWVAERTGGVSGEAAGGGDERETNCGEGWRRILVLRIDLLEIHRAQAPCQCMVDLQRCQQHLGVALKPCSGC